MISSFIQVVMTEKRIEVMFGRPPTTDRHNLANTYMLQLDDLPSHEEDFGLVERAGIVQTRITYLRVNM